MNGCMIDFVLNDHGEIELAQFGEDTEDFVWERCYPELHELLSREDVVQQRGGEYSDGNKEAIRGAVEHERKRLWAAQPRGAEAETEIGKTLQRELGMAGPVADFHVKRMADRVLRSRRTGKGNPN
jgi:hypothetical protein